VINPLLKLAAVGFSSLFFVTLSTRAVTKDSYINGLLTSLLAGSFYWLTLTIAIPKLGSVLAGGCYVLGSTTGRILAMWICINLLENKQWRNKKLVRKIVSQVW
jgi:hypothetical protein